MITTHEHAHPLSLESISSINNQFQMGGKWELKESFVVKLELCAEMALVLDARGYLLGCLVWFFRASLGCLSDFSLVKRWEESVLTGTLPALHIGAHIEHTLCVRMQLFDHLKGDF